MTSSQVEGSVEGEIWEGGGKRYRMEKVVGNGAFGIVWRAKDMESGCLVAIKKVILDRRYHNRELEMLRQLEHECVIRLLNHFEKPGRKQVRTRPRSARPGPACRADSTTGEKGGAVEGFELMAMGVLLRLSSSTRLYPWSRGRCSCIRHGRDEALARAMARGAVGLRRRELNASREELSGGGR
jgi:serine/threonine protein kinase